MSDVGLKWIAAPTAAEACPGYEPGEEAAPLLSGGGAPRDFLAALASARLYPDAIRFLAHALPKREAVWWACRCARATMPPDRPPEFAAAIAAAEAWVLDPSDEVRRATMPAAEAAGMGTAAGCAAVAAFVSGGSLAPAHLPVVPPGPHLTARGVAGSILIAAVATRPEQGEARMRDFLSVGIEVADGLDRWADSAETAPAATDPAATSPILPPPSPKATPQPAPAVVPHRPAPAAPRGFFQE